MSKGEQTRERILERAASLFNRQGYFGSSLSNIMQETGLEKGGIYNHFASKEQLALEAFDYAFGLIQQRVRLMLRGKYTATERLLVMMEVFQSIVDNPPVVGGCPILNTAIEADDAQPALRARAMGAMEQLRETFRRIVTRGIERGELRAEVSADEVATIFIATLEGAIMLSKLYGDSVHMRRVVEHLKQYVQSMLVVDANEGVFDM
jgi:TetR/AcrR family transcriptional repressor of nem operon